MFELDENSADEIDLGEEIEWYYRDRKLSRWVVAIRSVITSINRAFQSLILLADERLQSWQDILALCFETSHPNGSTTIHCYHICRTRSRLKNDQWLRRYADLVIGVSVGDLYKYSTYTLSNRTNEIRTKQQFPLGSVRVDNHLSFQDSPQP